MVGGPIRNMVRWRECQEEEVVVERSSGDRGPCNPFIIQFKPSNKPSPLMALAPCTCHKRSTTKFNPKRFAISSTFKLLSKSCLLAKIKKKRIH